MYRTKELNALNANTQKRGGKMTRPHVHNILVHFCHNAFHPQPTASVGASSMSKVIKNFLFDVFICVSRRVNTRIPYMPNISAKSSSSMPTRLIKEFSSSCRVRDPLYVSYLALR